MRISDWSSDVCSSDLLLGSGPGKAGSEVGAVEGVPGGGRVNRLHALLDRHGDGGASGKADEAGILPCLHRHLLDPEGVEAAQGSRGVGVAEESSLVVEGRQRERGEGVGAGSRLLGLRPAGPEARALVAVEGDEIGRATCGDRRRQYVWIPG